MSRLTQKRAGQFLEHLRFAKKRDAIKGGNGTRSTVDLADGVGISTDKARRILWKMVDAGQIEAFSGEGSGLGPVYWGIKEKTDG